MDVIIKYLYYSMNIQRRFTYPIDESDVERELEAGAEVIVQFSEKTYNNKVLSYLDKLCSIYNNNFALRFFGHYSTFFEFKNLLKVPNVKNLYVESLTNSDNERAIENLQCLERLSLSIFGLKETELLDAQNLKQLSQLAIGPTKTKAVNLRYLQDYRRLTSLGICGHSKNIDAIGEISTLESLSLISLKKESISFVNKLKKLQKLRLMLGGRENLFEIEENEIRQLEVIRIRGFNDLGDLSRFKKLNTLFIEDNIQLLSIHLSSNFVHLEELCVYNCKSLQSISGLETLPGLKVLRLHRTDINFHKLITNGLPPSLRIFTFSTGKAVLDKEINGVLESKGYIDGFTQA